MKHPQQKRTILSKYQRLDLGRNPNKVLRVFLAAIHSHIYSFAWDFYFFKLTEHLTVSFSVKEKGGKSDRKPYPLPYGLRNPYRNLKSENSQDCVRKPQRDCMSMNSASVNFYRGKQEWHTVSIGVPFFRMGRSERSPSFSIVTKLLSDPNLKHNKDDIFFYQTLWIKIIFGRNCE
jgi:hypothetical protein